jgi:hypothetical protein
MIYLSVIAFGPFFTTTILHIPNKISNSKKADRIEEVKVKLTSILSNTGKYNDVSYIGRSVLKQKISQNTRLLQMV